MKFNFAKYFGDGGIMKFQNPATPISYDITGFLKGLDKYSFTKQSSNTSMTYSPKFTSQGEIKTVEDLEKSKDYTDFTQYVLDNAESNEDVKKYLLQIELKSGKTGYIFNPDGSFRDNWKTNYTNARNDGKYGFFHLNPLLNNTSATPGNQPETPPGNDNPENSSKGNYTPLQFTPEQGPQKQPWTDWVNLTALRLNDAVTIARNTELQKKQKYNLQEAPYLLHKVTDDYYQRSANALNIANQRTAANRAASNLSDLNASMNYRLLAENLFSTAELKNEALKAQTYATEMDKAQQVANYNNLIATSVANNNNQQNAAAFNNIINANRQRNLMKNSSANLYIQNMATSWGLHVKDQKTNLADHEKSKALADYTYATTKGDEITRYKDIKGDFTKSNAYQQAMKDLGTMTSTGGEPLDLKTLWENSDESMKSYIEQYTKELELAKQAATDAETLAYLRYNDTVAKIPYIISNQGFTIGNKPWYNSTVSPLYFGKGGYIGDRFIAFMKTHASKQEKERASNLKAVLGMAKITEEKLKRLDAQQLLLLRQAFK